MIQINQSLGNVIISGNLIPSIGGIYDLGTPSLPFSAIYLKQSTIYFDNDNNQVSAAMSFNPNTGALDISSNGATQSTLLLYNGNTYTIQDIVMAGMANQKKHMVDTST
jgi:hypothetical protein